jgi:YD repeat-containing protein
MVLSALLLAPAASVVEAATCLEEYCYDSAGRLQIALLCGAEYRFTYDAAGNLIERTVAAGSSPLVCDADADGLPDTAETATGIWVSPADTGTDPFVVDTDGDGLADGVETHTGNFVSASDTGSDPHQADTDGDGVDDGAEVAAGTDPNTPPPAVPGLGPVGLGVSTGLLLGAGLLAWHARRRRGIAAMLLLCVPGQALVPTTARAAVCGPAAVTLGMGDTNTTQIRAAAADELLGDTSYNVVSNTAPVTVSPAIQSTSQLANFQIAPTGLLGSGTAQIDWLAPSGSTGSCALNIEVVATPPPPTSANNRDAPAWGGVDLFTGERLIGSWTLIDLGGPLPVRFSMGYASALTRDGQLPSSLGDGWSHGYDYRLFSAGSETRVALPSGRTLRFGESGGVYTLTGPLETPYQLVADGAEHVLLHPRSHLRYRFDAAGRLVSIFDRNGNALTLSYTGQLLSQVSDGLGRTLSFGYDTDHFLAQVDDGTRTVGFSVTARQLDEFTNAEGHTTQFAYSNLVPDTPGLLTEVTQADGTVPYTFAYSGVGRVTSRTAASVASGGTGGTATFALVGSSATVTDEAGEVWNFTLDASGNPLGLVDPDGHTRSWSFDAKGRPSAFVDAHGNTSSFAYEATGGAVAQITRPDLAVATTSFSLATDVLGLVDVDPTAWVDFDGSGRSVVRDAFANVTSYSDAASEVWTFTYDGQGRPLTVTSPASVTSAFTYDANSNLATVTDGAGNVTTTTYDSLYRLVQVDAPGGVVSAFSYDANNNVVSATDGAGNVTTSTYDALDRPVEVTDPAAGLWQFFYNAMGALEGVLDPLGNGWTAGYDGREQLVNVDDATGRSTEFGYDARGNSITTTDNAGETRSAMVNEVGAPSSFTDRLGNTRTLTYDALDRLIGTTSPLGLERQRTVDPVGRTTSVIGPAGRTHVIGRDERGAVSTLTGPDGSETSVARNEVGQATAITDPNGSTWTQSFDAAGRLDSFGDPLGNVVTQGYDSRNRVNQLILPAGLGNLGIDYDGNDRISQLAYSDGTTYVYTYDSNDRISGATGVTLAREATGRIAESNGIQITYDAADRITQVEYGPGVWVQFLYDTHGWLQSMIDWTDPLNPAVVIGRDLEGKIISLTRANGTQTQINYDDDGRIANLQHGGPGPVVLAEVTIAYGLDGRPASKTRTADVVDPGVAFGTRTIARNAAGWPTHDGSPITHDEIGRRLSDGVRTYTWRLDGTPESITSGGVTALFDADGFGAPATIAVGAQTTILSWLYSTRAGSLAPIDEVWGRAGGAPSLAVIDQGADVQVNVNHPVTGETFYTVDLATGARTYLNYDEKGSAWVWTDDAGNAVLTRAYGPDGTGVAHAGDLDASGLVPVGYGAAYGWLDLDGLYLPPLAPPLDPTTVSALRHIEWAGPFLHNGGQLDRLENDRGRLIQGSRGPAVEELQRLLNASHADLSTDSIFDALPWVIDGGRLMMPGASVDGPGGLLEAVTLGDDFVLPAEGSAFQSYFPSIDEFLPEPGFACCGSFHPVAPIDDSGRNDGPGRGARDPRPALPAIPVEMIRLDLLGTNGRPLPEPEPRPKKKKKPGLEIEIEILPIPFGQLPTGFEAFPPKKTSKKTPKKPAKDANIRSHEGGPWVIQ